MMKLGSHNEVLNTVKNVNLKNNQCKPFNCNEEIMDKFTFNELSFPFGPLICEKILEAQTLLNSQKAKLTYCQSIKSNEKFIESQHVKIDREINGGLENENTDKLQTLRKKLHWIIRNNIDNEIEQIISSFNIAELEKFAKDKNIFSWKIKEIMSLEKGKTFGIQNIDKDLYSSGADYKEEEDDEEGEGEETDVFRKLHSQINQSEFGQYLNRENLKSKIHLCRKLYPSVEKHAGSSTDNLMEKFLELDNAFLNYLLADETALQKKMDILIQSEMNVEFINKLGFYGIDAKMKINNFLGNIKNQSIELGKMQSVITGFQNWMSNYSQFLSTLTAHKQQVLTDLDNIMQALHDASTLSNTNFSIYSDSSSKVKTNVVQNESPINYVYPPSRPPPVMQPNSLIFQPNYLLQPNFNAPNHPFLLNQNRFGIMPVFNNCFKSELPIYSSQNNINSSFLCNNNNSDLAVNELFKNNENLQNFDETTENSEFDKSTNSEEMNEQDNCSNEFINSKEKLNIKDPLGVSGMENIDRVEMDVVSNYTFEESVNDDYYDSTDWTDEVDENMMLPFKIEEKKIKEHNEIYLENLHPDVDEKILLDIFEQYGDIISIRLMRDPETRQSLEIAYVTYVNNSAANSAFEQVNFKNIYGRKCLIKWSESNKIIRNSTEGNVFIKNLDLSFDTEQIYHLFKSYGEIVSCKVQVNPDGGSRGFAFVRYNNKENAEKAIDEMNGKLIGNKVIYVGKFLSKAQRKKEAKGDEFTNCYVNNFGTFLDDKSLREMFEVFGEIKSSKVELDENGTSKGFGFVSFSNHIDAAEAVKTLNGKIIEDKMIYVGRAMKKSERQRDKSKINLHGDLKNNIYINKLNKNIDDERLRQEFAVFGPIISAKVMRNEDDNSSMGYGFVCFQDPKDAAVAIEKMNRKIIEGQSIYVNLCLKISDKVHNVKAYSNETSNENANISDQKFRHLVAAPNQNVNVPFLQNPLITNPVYPQMFPLLSNVGPPPIMVTNRPFCGPSQITALDKPGSNNIKEYYGNILYPRVKIHAGNLTGKIVGMILHLENHVITNLINNEAALVSMINEAANLLNAHRITGSQ